MFEIGQTTVPAIKTDIARGEPACLCGLEHGAKMVILGQAIIRCIKQAIIAWDGVRVVTPYECHQVDPGDGPVVFA